MSEKGVTKDQLDRLENHSTNALLRIWAKCMQIVNRRRRKGEKKYMVILTDPNALAGGQAHGYRYRDQSNKKSTKEIQSVVCTHRCAYCIMGYKQKDDKFGTGCLLKDMNTRVRKKKKGG